MLTTDAHGKICHAFVEGAGSYDHQTAQYQHWRRRIVDLLPLAPGDTVLDVGCGTGLCLPTLAQRVGPSGTVVGIDQSPEMLDLARRRMAEAGADHVTFVEAAVEDVDIDVTADAALFCAVHDVLRSEPALERVFSHLRPGAWVAAGGGKWAPAWMLGLNSLVFATHERYVNDFEGFDRPWSRLGRFVDELKVTDLAVGYLAVGRAR